MRTRAKSGERTVDARRIVRTLAALGPGRLRLELAVGPEGSLRPAALVGELLGLPAATLPTLRVHKVATRFHDRTTPAA